jgi:hypothetical protein
MKSAHVFSNPGTCCATNRKLQVAESQKRFLRHAMSVAFLEEHLLMLATVAALSEKKMTL